MAKKKLPTVEELLESLPQEEKAEIPRQILEAIQQGKDWKDPTLVDLFRYAPNRLDSKSKAWLPRHIQVQIGKAVPTQVVVKYARRPSSRQKAVYQSVDEYLESTGKEEVDVPVSNAYMIYCPCGVSYIGKEPEHQLQCEGCKIKNKAKPTPSAEDERGEQINTMFRIIRARNLRPEVRDRAIVILKKKMSTWGFSDEEIINAFENQGYTREQIEEMH